MNKSNIASNLYRFCICIFAFSFFLYLYTDQQNSLTRLRFRVPAIANEIKLIREDNMRLQYAIDRFESPQNLLDLARQSEFSHLKQPLVKEILNCQEGIALRLSNPEERIDSYTPSKATLATVP
jgi:hypothetical protein